MKKRRYFSYKKRNYITYNCFKKVKIAIILEVFIENNRSQEKD